MHLPHFRFLLLLFVGTTASLVHCKTNSHDVSALNNMFTSLNSPSQLSNWKSNGGDPCDESWEGIKCSGSSVTKIDLSDLGLSGSLGYQLSNLKDVTYFDLSKNNLQNDIPYQLPPNLVHLDLSNNQFSGNVPYSISQMNDLQYLNFGHNHLNGQLSDMFTKLPKLKEMYLNDNSLTGNLPQSMAQLSSLETLYLQNNQLTGSINVLAGLPLGDLNIKDNQFTGWIPDELKDIDSLETSGNDWSTGRAPPPPPGAKPVKHHSEDSDGGFGKAALKGLFIALIALAALVALALVVVLITRRKSSPNSHFIDEERANNITFTPIGSRKLSNESISGMTKQLRDSASFDSNDSRNMQIPASRGYKPPPSPSDLVQSINENEFANRLNAGRRSTSIRAAPYSLADLQSATGNFASARLLGEGSLGSVYKAKYPDGKIFAVKKIDSSFFQDSRPEEFSELVMNISKVHHPNIAELVGYCAEKGQSMLVFEYFRNGSIHDFLHVSDEFSKPLTWNTRVRIALGTARAVEYLHEVCSPSFDHKNIKSSNILLDLDLNPRLSDYGLANLHHRTSLNLGEGYNAPECTNPSAYTMKSDVYSFGVVMLELLTGRMPLDHTKPKAEQNLVRWATPQLHDKEALEDMVDPHLRGLYPPKSVSRFADIIALCVQAEPEFRPPMSEVVESLVKLIQLTNESMKEDLGASRGTSVSDC